MTTRMTLGRSLDWTRAAGRLLPMANAEVRQVRALCVFCSRWSHERADPGNALIQQDTDRQTARVISRRRDPRPATKTLTLGRLERLVGPVAICSSASKSASSRWVVSRGPTRLVMRSTKMRRALTFFFFIFFYFSRQVAWLGLNGIQFRRVGGNSWQYQELAKRILLEMRL
jgi:hypothetical protein